MSAEAAWTPPSKSSIICAASEHVWDEGDNDAIYCGICNGYACDVCAATGRAANDYGGTAKCFACSGYGVVMWWKPEQRWISPPNYIAAHCAADAGGVDSGDEIAPALRQQPGARQHEQES